MKKIVPFKKDILFKTNISEITSISLEHELNIDKNLIKGKFIVSGDYINETTKDKFSHELPFIVDLDEKYILDKANLDIDDFYYEIVGNNTLRVCIDVLIDNLDERKIEIINERECIEEEVEPPKIEEKKKDTTEKEESYKSYTVYIVRENDNIDTIQKKYEITKEELEKYNDLTNIKIGDKIIIPC